MKVSINRFLKSELIKVFSLNALATFIKILVGFISTKFVAVIIGPSGVALLGQLTNFSSILLTISTGGIGNGLTSSIAANRETPSKVATYISTATTITIILSLLSGLIAIIYSDYLTLIILKNQVSSSIIFTFGCLIILYGINSLIISIISGYKQFKKYVQVNIAGSIISLLFTLILTYTYGLKGALIAIVSYQSIVLIVTVILCHRSNWFTKANFFGKFNLSASKKLGQYSIMALTSAAAIPVSQLIIRNYIVNEVSISKAGIWEGMNRISISYLMIITTSLSVYYLPRLSELKTKISLRNEIIKVYKLVIPLIIVMSVVIYFMRVTIVKILFDDNFIEMESLFLFQLIGDFFKVSSWILAYLMVAKSMTKWFIFTEILFSTLLVILSLYFIEKYGILGVTVAYSINYFFHLLCMIYIFRKIIFKYD